MKRILYIIYIMVATLAVTLIGGCEEQVFEYDFINNAGEEPTPTPTPGVSANKVIYYTSTDGKMITEPAGITGWVSHTYKNGQGAITYNHDIKLIPDEAFKGYKTLKSIKLPSSVTSIGDKTFYNCVNLTSITIPSSVTSIGDNAFESCTSLTSAIIPKSVTSIGNYTFHNCTSLTSVTIPNGVTSIGNYTFNNCKSLTSVTIPESVTSIGNYAFYNCIKLTSITIPSSVTSIGNWAFDYCTTLKRVDIADLEAWCKIDFSNSAANPIDNEADLYLNGSKLTELTIPNGITAIKPYTFSRCTSITNVTIPGHVTEIGNRAFYYCNNLTSAIIGEGVTAIGDEVFYSCSKLAEVYCKPTTPPTLGGDKAFTNNASNRMIFVPSESVDKYKYAPFWNTHKSSIVADPSADPSIATNTIEYTSTDGNIVTPYSTSVFGANIVSNVYENGKGTITFDGPVTTIGKEAFYKCSTLTSVTIPNGVTSIGDYVFYYCSGLTSVTIPNSVTSIGDRAFYGCTSLTSVTIPNSVTSIGERAFSRCTSLKSIYGKFASEDNRCLIINGELKSFAPAGLASYIIPNSVTSIGNYTFYYCSGLTSVTIPNNVTSIGNYAFGYCSGLTSVTIPNNVTSIGNHAFRYCSGLTSVTIPDSVTSIGNNAFYNCTSLTSVTIPNNVTEIEGYAFYGCTSLSSVTIPNSVTSIGDYAFRNCTSLSSVTIPNSVTSIGNYAFYSCSKLAEVYCKPTTPPTLGGSAVFDNNATDRKMYVPSASVDAYKAANYWSEYASQIVAEGSSTTEYVIEYTSTDGAIVTPNTNADFGANIVSNVYENGKGVITFDGPVTKIASITNTNLDGAFYNCKTLKSITIPESVTLMEDYPFIGCSSLSTVNITDLSAWCRIDFANALDNPLHDVGKLHLNGSAITSLTIPSDITEIKKYAFYGYTSLTDVTIHNKVTSIGSYAFDSCGLASVTIPESVTSAESAFNGCTSLVAFYGKYATDDNRCLIINGKLISFAIGCGATSYTIPDNVTSIGKCAFSSCSSLTNIVIPNKVTSIGSSAFYDCTSLTNVTIGSGVTSIGSSAFEWCSSLTNVFIPDSVTSIGGGAFWGCKSLTSATIGSGVTTIHNQAFQACSSLSTVNISDLSAWCRIDFADSSSNPLYISEGKLCLNGSEITSLTIPSNITKIKKYTFYKCSSLTDVTIHDKVTSIGESVFYQCASLTNVTIGSGVTSIGNYAFGNCTSLTSVTIPNSVTSIGNYAFRYCSKLAEVYCKPTTPPTLGGVSVFYSNASGRKIYVPSASVNAYKTATNWSEYASQIVAE